VVASEYAPIVVCDAGPLIHLDELQAIDLLADFSEVIVPAAVWKEIQRYRPSALRSRHLSLHLVDLIPEATPELELLIQGLSLQAGEQDALRLMQKFSAATLLTDDASARLAALQLGYSVHGTVGIVIRAIPTGQRSKRQVLNLLRAVPKRSTLFIKAEFLASIITKVAEGFDGIALI
jgi:predicted nucleic acid-binding protein